MNSIPEKSFDYFDKKYSKLSNDVQKQSEKLLKKMQQKESKLQEKLRGIDSLKTKQLFDKSQEKYKELEIRITGPVTKVNAKLKEYLPGLDSVSGALKFLQQNGSGLGGFSSDKLDQIGDASKQIWELQGRLQQANEIQNFIRERERQLKETLSNTGLGKELLAINKEVYYYQQMVKEYKTILHEPDRLEAKAFEVLNRIPAFQKFIEKNSMLAGLLRIPSNYGTPAALDGLQTSAQIQQQVNQAFAGSGTNPQQYISQEMQVAQAQLNKLKDKVNQLGGGSSDMTMPDFKPDNQKTKKFWQRLEYGINVQNQRGTLFLPSMSDLAFSLGYKISDSKSIGIGASYKIGLGSGLNNIRFTSEGIGLRSYADVRFKGSIWIAGGFEYNYLQRFNNFNDIKNIDIWQRSALIGVSKKFKAGKKGGDIKLLYDLLNNKQVPPGQALKFRMGYSF
ncbi:hypothetical protein [Limnovirga soli]|uniref:Uncharacterized protein n=1 Tax=Limnovirga soli TaxID=2656915 RepID=A0A8J8FE82_9BACT|nr:hypothetical protein [Limnovirga soli]NNV55073.1 hypothetical protein [Limnovirga soli]